MGHTGDLSYTDRYGRRSQEYISLGCDTVPVLRGRTPVQCYRDFMVAFRNRFSCLLGSTIVVCGHFHCRPFCLRMTRVSRCMTRVLFLLLLSLL